VKSISFFSLFLNVFFCFAQSQKIEELSLDELKMKSWKLDSSASAVVLFSKGEFTINLRSTTAVTYKVQRRIKIFKKDAFEEWGNITIPFSNAKVAKIKATTYNLENGEVVSTPLDESTILKRHVNKYTDEMTFAFPDLKEGSVVEYSFTIFYHHAFARGWHFQHTIPTAWSEYSITSPSEIPLSSERTGDFSPLTHETKYEGTYQKWIFKDLPAFKAEPLMPDQNAYISSINFWITYSSWNALKETLIENTTSFYDVTKHASFWNKKVDEIIGTKTDQKEKIEAISKFLKENIEWDGGEDFYAANPTEVLEHKKGSSGDINLLFGSLLRRAGIETDFVLLSTKENGYVKPQLQTLSQFNYVVCRCRVNKGFVFMDATDKYLPYDVLPVKCLNRRGLIVSKADTGWTDVTQNTKAKTIVSSNFTITDDGALAGKITVSNYGYNANRVRRALETQTKEEYVKKFSRNGAIDIEESNLENIHDLNKPAVETYKVVLGDHITTAGDLLFINPFFLLKDEERFFQLEKRRYPLDLETLVEKIYLGSITIPENYTVDAMPPDKVVTLPDNAAKFSCSFRHVGNQINVMTNLQINTTFFLPDEYLNLREFYQHVIAKQAEQIVLKKK